MIFRFYFTLLKFLITIFNINILSTTSLNFKIFNTIQSAKVELPESLFATSLLLNSVYLEAVESTHIKGLVPFYVVVYDVKKALGLVYFQAINLAAKELGGIIHLEPYGKFLNLVSDKLNNLLFSSDPGKSNWLLVCGNMSVSGQHAISCLPEYLTLVCDTLPQIIKGVCLQVESQGKLSATILKDFPFSNDPVKSTILKEGFISFVMDPIMEIHQVNNWKNFDEYLDSMTSKYRLRANNVIKKIETFKQLDFNLTDIESNVDRINELYFAVQHRSPVRLVKPDAQCFIHLKKHLKNNFLFKAFYLEDKMVAFMTGIFNTYEYEAYHIGIDYHYNKDYALYQNILYSFINEAINARVNTLSFGRTALEMKTTVGAKPYDYSAYMYLNNRILNKLVKPFLPDNPPTNWTPRDPFKNGK